MNSYTPDPTKVQSSIKYTESAMNTTKPQIVRDHLNSQWLIKGTPLRVKSPKNPIVIGLSGGTGVEELSERTIQICKQNGWAYAGMPEPETKPDVTLTKEDDTPVTTSTVYILPGTHYVVKSRDNLKVIGTIDDKGMVRYFETSIKLLSRKATVPVDTRFHVKESKIDANNAYCRHNKCIYNNLDEAVNACIDEFETEIQWLECCGTTVNILDHNNNVHRDWTIECPTETDAKALHVKLAGVPNSVVTNDSQVIKPICDSCEAAECHCKCDDCKPFDVLPWTYKDLPDSQLAYTKLYHYNPRLVDTNREVVTQVRTLLALIENTATNKAAIARHIFRLLDVNRWFLEKNTKFWNTLCNKINEFAQELDIPSKELAEDYAWMKDRCNNCGSIGNGNCECWEEDDENEDDSDSEYESEEDDCSCCGCETEEEEDDFVLIKDCDKTRKWYPSTITHEGTVYKMYEDPQHPPGRKYHAEEIRSSVAYISDDDVVLLFWYPEITPNWAISTDPLKYDSYNLDDCTTFTIDKKLYLDGVITLKYIPCEDDAPDFDVVFNLGKYLENTNKDLYDQIKKETSAFGGMTIQF